MSIVDSLSGLTHRLLSPAHHLALRNAYFSVRKQSAPLLKLVYGTFDARALCSHLESRIGADFDCLMVHSSINKLAPMYRGGPLELVKALLELVGPERTLAMPAFYFGDPKIGGLLDTLRARPELDLRRTPSQVGMATELFRRMPGVLCSRHPIYRVCALGPLAEALTTGHECAMSNCGAGTPFDVMAAHQTWIAGVGTSIEILTQVHHAEDVLGDEFPVPRAPSRHALEIRIRDGDERIPYRLPGGGLLWRRNMWRLRALMPKGQLLEWNFHGAPMFAVRAADVSNALIDAAKRGETIYERPKEH
jgi:aminoglycoside 3-N-acetyltransferase